MTPDWLTSTAAARPNGLALVAEGRAWTYAALDRDVDAMVARLAADGVRPGDHVGVLLPNSAAYVLLIHALARLDAVLVALNTRLTAGEVAYQVAAADCTAVIHDDSTAGTAREAAEDERQVRLIPVKALTPTPSPCAKPPERAGRGEADAAESHESTLTGSGQSHEPLGIDLNAMQAILFTSGTTGRPKGAQITFGNHWFSAVASAWRVGVLPDDRWLVCLPLYHAGGLAIVWRSCIYGTAVILESGFSVERVAEAFAAHAISLVSLVPTQLYRLMDADVRWPVSLRLGLLGGGAATPELMARATGLGLPVATTYGLTETASQVATLPPEAARRKPGSVGKALTFSSITIVDEQGTPLPVGETGEVVVRGPTVMSGYYRQPESRTLRDGALYTGDLGYLDGDGDLWIVQRRSDLIVSGGENVYPAEVEAILRQHPAVADVCVVGVANAEWGQVVAAAVVLKHDATVDEAALIAFCRERLAGYKRPRRVLFVDALPQTASGKVIRPAVAAFFHAGQS